MQQAAPLVRLKRDQVLGASRQVLVPGLPACAYNSRLYFGTLLFTHEPNYPIRWFAGISHWFLIRSCVMYTYARARPPSLLISALHHAGVALTSSRRRHVLQVCQPVESA